MLKRIIEKVIDERLRQPMKEVAQAKLALQNQQVILNNFLKEFNAWQAEFEKKTREHQAKMSERDEVRMELMKIHGEHVEAYLEKFNFILESHFPENSFSVGPINPKCGAV